MNFKTCSSNSFSLLPSSFPVKLPQLSLSAFKIDPTFFLPFYFITLITFILFFSLLFVYVIVDDEEHKLRYTEIYNDFHGLFEEQLETFCHAKGLTHAEFMKKCNAASTEDEKAKHYIDILLASCEYNTFVRLMRIMKPVALQRLSKKAEAKSTVAESNDTDYSSPSKGEPIGESKTSKDLDDDFEQLSVSDAKKGDDDHVSPAKETFNDNTRGAGDKDSYYDEK